MGGEDVARSRDRGIRTITDGAIAIFGRDESVCALTVCGKKCDMLIICERKKIRTVTNKVEAVARSSVIGRSESG